ncbi:transporter [Sulfitobacter sp. JL08]|nr:transporter [Sulfitobacter sp. JL08]
MVNAFRSKIRNLCVKGIFALVAVLMVLGGAPGKGRAETLADALIGAYTHSGLLDQNRALLRAADEDVARAVSALRPIISWSAAIENGSVYGRSTLTPTITDRNSTNLLLGLNAEILLYDGGSSKLAVEAAKETLLATRYNLVAIEQDVFLRTVSAFFTVISAAEFVALRQNNVRLISEQLRAAQDRFEVGEVTRTDVAQAESRLAAGRSGLAVAQGDYFIAVEEYKNVVGRAPGNLVAPGRLPSIPGNIDSAKNQAVRGHPFMLQVQREVAAAELNILRAKSDIRPRITLDGRIASDDKLGSSNFGQSASVGLRMNQVIYGGGALSASVRQAIAFRDAARGNLHRVRHDLQQNVGNAVARLAVARAALESSEQQIVAARIAFDGIREEAALGARTTLDVLDAEQELLDAQATRISAQAQQYIAAYAVLSSIGTLTADGLNLAVQRYDPAAYYDLVKDAPTASSRQGKQLDKVLKSLGKE